MHMTLIAAAVANGGVMVEPHLLARITTAQGGTRELPGSREGKRVLSESVAARLEKEMVRVVKSGTGTRAALEGGYVRAGEDTRTSLPLVYAAGDVRTKPLRQVICAASDGAVAATMAQMDLERIKL